MYLDVTGDFVRAVVKFFKKIHKIVKNTINLYLNRTIDIYPYNLMFEDYFILIASALQLVSHE